MNEASFTFIDEAELASSPIEFGRNYDNYCVFGENDRLLEMLRDALLDVKQEALDNSRVTVPSETTENLTKHFFNHLSSKQKNCVDDIYVDHDGGICVEWIEKKGRALAKVIERNEIKFAYLFYGSNSGQVNDTFDDDFFPEEIFERLNGVLG